MDKSKLVGAIADAKAKLDDGKTYTETTLNALKAALETAKTVNSRPEATQQEVNNALSALETAIAGLREESPSADRTALNAAMRTAEEIQTDGKV